MDEKKNKTNLKNNFLKIIESSQKTSTDFRSHKYLIFISHNNFCHERKQALTSGNILPLLYADFKNFSKYYKNLCPFQKNEDINLKKNSESKYVSYSTITENFYDHSKNNMDQVIFMKTLPNLKTDSSEPKEKSQKNNESEYFKNIGQDYPKVNQEYFEAPKRFKSFSSTDKQFFKSFAQIESYHNKKMKNQGKTNCQGYLKQLEKRTKSLDRIAKRKSPVTKVFSLQETVKNFKNTLFIRKKSMNLDKSKPDMFNEFKNPEKSYETLIDNLYQKKLLQSKHLLKYFKNKDIEKVLKIIGNYIYNILKENNENFLTKEHLKAVHKSLEITHEDYDLYKGFFAIMMREMCYSEELITYFSIGLEKVREYIVHNKTFNEIFPHSDKSLNFLLSEMKNKLEDNLTLSYFFNKKTQENVYIHQKRIINMIFGTIPFVNQENNIYRSYHRKCELTYFEFFDLKNIITNSLLEIYNSSIKNYKSYPITFPKEIEKIFSNIEKLRPLILPSRNLENGINLKYIAEIISKKLLQQKVINELFMSWSFNRFTKHTEYVLRYIFKFSTNRYFESDLIPAHCKVTIKSSHFSIVRETILKVLSESNNINPELIKRAIQDLDCSKHHICKEKTFYENIGGDSFVHPCIDHIYVNLFGNPATKHFFTNADGDYVKYKQKIFFCKVFQNKIGSQDYDDLKAIHARLNISKDHFDLFIKFMKDHMTLTQMQLSEEEFIVKEIKNFEPYIVIDSKKIII